MGQLDLRRGGLLFNIFQDILEEMIKRLLYLDGLKGLLAFCVVFNHYINAFYPAFVTGNYFSTHSSGNFEIFIAKTPLNILYNGNFALCIFIIISGFLLGYSFFGKKKDHLKTSLIPAVMKRYVGLVIPIFVSCLLGYLILKLGLSYNLKISGATKSTAYLAAIYNFTPSIARVFVESFVRPLSGTINTALSYNPVIWMMKVEFLGSLISLSVLFLFSSKKYRYVIYIILLVFFLKSYFVLFVLGALLADMYSSKKGSLDFFRYGGVQLALVAGILYLGSFPQAISVDHTIYEYLNFGFIGNTTSNMVFWHTIAALLALMLVLSSTKIQGLLENKKIVFLGGISFAVFLIHFLVLVSFSSYLFLLLSLHMNYFPSVIITFIVSMAFIIGTAYLFNRFVIKFSNLLADSFSNKINNTVILVVGKIRSLLKLESASV